MNLRSVCFDFEAFVSPVVLMDRGDDETAQGLGKDEFRLETFLESQYRIDEFWGRSESRVVISSRELGVMACPQLNVQVQLRSDTACRDGAVTPPRSVSYSLNLRLDRAEDKVNGIWVTRPVRLNDSILEVLSLPLIWDTDGEIAGARGITPHYSAPPGEPDGPYGRGREWFPDIGRHGQLQVGFVSGEVLTSKAPLDEANWQWAYNP